MRTASPSPMEDTVPISDSPSPKSSTDCPPPTSSADSSSPASYSYLSPDSQSDHDSQLAPEYYSLEISDIDLHHAPKVGWNSLDDHFWLQIIADGKITETTVASRGSLFWPDKFTFNVRKSSKLIFRLYAQRYIHENKVMGEVRRPVDTLVTQPDDIMVFSGWYNPLLKDPLRRTTLLCKITRRKLSPEEAEVEVANTRRLRVSNIVIHHLPRVKLISLDDHFFIQIEIDGKIACITDIQRGHSLQWRKEHLCHYRKDSRIQLKIFAHRRIHADHLICVISDEVESWLQFGSIRRELSGSKKEHEIPASIEFQIASATPAILDDPQPLNETPLVLDSWDVMDATVLTPSSVEITDIRLTHLPKIGHFAFNDQFFVQLKFEGGTQSTSLKTQKHGSVGWNEKFTFLVPETTILSFEVSTRRYLCSDEYIGMLQISEFPQDSIHEGQLVAFTAQGKTNLDTKLSFRIRRNSSFDERSGGSVPWSPTQHSDRSLPLGPIDVAIPVVGAMIPTAPQNVDNGNSSLQTRSQDLTPQQSAGEVAIPNTGAMTSAVLQNAMQLQIGVPAVVQNIANDMACVFEPLLSRIDTFVRIGHAFSAAHPYTKMAFMILTAGYEVIRRQLARDERIRDLATTISDSYYLVSDTADLCRFQGQAETINLLARQTTECAYFIRDYANYKSGARNCIANLFSNIDATTQGYETAFKDIRTALEQKVVLNTQLVVWHIHDTLKGLAAKVDLSALPYATGASYHAQKRYDNVPVNEDLLTEISGWVNGQSSHTIYLLVGSRGSEASAAAHVIAHQFDDINRLGSSYCLDRSRLTNRKPTNLFSTIARDLADHDLEFMDCLGKMVKRVAVGSSPHIPTQFTFILSPAQQLTSFGPVLIVIDALDACGDPHSREDVLRALVEKAANLPPRFKFLITCLPRTDVDVTLRDKVHIRRRELDVLVTEQLGDEGSIVGRSKPWPPTPPIQTAFPEPDYFSMHKSPTGASDTSSSPSSIAPSIFDGELHTFSPVSDISSPVSGITSCGGTVSPKQITKRIESTEEHYFVEHGGQVRTVKRTNVTQTIHHHVSPTPRPARPLAFMLDEPNAPFLTAEPAQIPANGITSVIPRNISTHPQKMKCKPNMRQDIIVHSEAFTSGPQPCALLSA